MFIIMNGDDANEKREADEVERMIIFLMSLVP